MRLDNKHEAKVKIAFELPPNGVRVMKKRMMEKEENNCRINDLTDNVQVGDLAFHGVSINLTLNGREKRIKE